MVAAAERPVPTQRRTAGLQVCAIPCLGATALGYLTPRAVTALVHVPAWLGLGLVVGTTGAASAVIAWRRYRAGRAPTMTAAWMAAWRVEPSLVTITALALLGASATLGFALGLGLAMRRVTSVHAAEMLGWMLACNTLAWARLRVQVRRGAPTSAG